MPQAGKQALKLVALSARLKQYHNHTLPVSFTATKSSIIQECLDSISPSPVHVPQRPRKISRQTTEGRKTSIDRCLIQPNT